IRSQILTRAPASVPRSPTARRSSSAKNGTFRRRRGLTDGPRPYPDRARTPGRVAAPGDSRMNLRSVTGSALAACLMLFASLGAAQDDKDKTEKKKEPADPPRTAQYMNQLRLVFDTWDVNKDGYLDKKELAVAFRGKGSLP